MYLSGLTIAELEALKASIEEKIRKRDQQKIKKDSSKKVEEDDDSSSDESYSPQILSCFEEFLEETETNKIPYFTSHDEDVSEDEGEWNEIEIVTIAKTTTNSYEKEVSETKNITSSQLTLIKLMKS